MAGRITGYTTLVSAVVEAMEDDGAEFSTFIPTAIDLAEQRMTKELDSFGIRMVATISGTASVNLLNKPSGYRLGHTFTFTASNGEITQLRKRQRSFIEDYWPFGNSSVANPKYYADYSSNQFIICPSPDSDYNFDLSYEGRPTVLAAGASVNYFTSVLSDSLFYATMKEINLFAKNYQAAEIWDKQYISTMIANNNQGRRERAAEGFIPESPSPQINTLKNEN